MAQPITVGQIHELDIPVLTAQLEGPPEPEKEPPPPEPAPPAETSTLPDVSPPTEALPEDVVAAESPAMAASPVKEAPPIHGEASVRAWFSDTFNNLVATGRVRERDAEAYLQDLLKRLGF